jgi:vacuolar-type H+-ATPase subunit C/Vma6
MKEKLASEIAYLAGNSSSPLDKFFSFIAERYMIDNVVILMEGAKNKLDKKYVMAQCDPLGYFPEMEKIIGIEDDLIELYKTVLIDTAVAKYFQRFIEDFFQSLQNRTLE